MQPLPIPPVIEFAKALARASVARDIATAKARKESADADRHLRTLQ